MEQKTESMTCDHCSKKDCENCVKEDGKNFCCENCCKDYKEKEASPKQEVNVCKFC